MAVADSLVTATCAATTLAPGAATTCTGTYTLTQVDVDSGVVNNTATATGRRPNGTTATSNPDSTATPTTTVSTLSLVKSALASTDRNANGLVDTGDTVGYRFAVANTGDQTLTALAIVDAKVGATSCPVTTLAPGASTTCTTITAYAITQADVDTGTVTNTATATAKNPSNTTITSNPSTASVGTATTARLSLVKSAGGVVDTNADGRIDAGDQLGFSFAVTNIGTQTVSTVAIADSKVGATTCPTTTLAAGASTTCTTTVAYVITQADVDTGAVTNTATVTGRSPLDATVTSDPSSTATPTSTVAALALVKSAGPPTDVNADGRVDTGDRITYSFAVTNAGPTTVRALAVTDAKIVGAIGCPSTTLAPGATTTCTATYAITQADVDAGSVDNSATVSGTTLNGAAVSSPASSTTTPTSTAATIGLTKTAAAPVDANTTGRLDAGDTIAYTLVATNTGAVTLTNAYPLDAQLPACAAITLAPSQSTTCTGTYVLTQPDLDRGRHDNTARAFGTTPTGGTVSAGPVTTSTPLPPVTGLSFTKRAGTPADVNGNSLVDAGDRVDYTFTAGNTGTVSITDFAVVDPLVAAVSCPVSSLAPGANAVCTGSYTLTQADVDAGAVTNTARATGADPAGRPVRSPDSSTTTTTAADTGLALVKTAATPVDVDANGRTDAGDRIGYTFSVTNTGALTVSALVINDARVSAVSCPTTTVAPGATVACTATYTVTQTDVDAGAVDNTATASGTDSLQRPVTSPASSTSTPTSTAAALTLTKTAATPTDVDGNGRVTTGDTVAYTFAVANTGAVTLTGLTISDARVLPTCPTTTLAPAGSTTCTATYAITQADVDAGTVVNTAAATARNPAGGTITSPASSVTTATSTTARLSLDKQAGLPVDVNSNGRTDTGDRIGYRFVVTNTGDLTLTTVAITDSLITGTATCPSTTLAPGASTTCTAVYVVSQADVDAGAVTNTATASSRNPAGGTVSSDPDATSTATSVEAALTLVKTAGTPVDVNADGRVDAGDTIAYTFAVTNTGAVTLTAVAVTDSKITAGVSCPAGSLAPGVSSTCSASYAITQVDVDAGTVVNTASARGTDPGGATIGSPPSTTTTPTTTQASVVFDKTAAAPVDANADGRIDAGDTIAYQFAVTNTGAVTLNALVIGDNLVTASCPATVLAPGATVTCTGTYVIPQAAIDAGAVNNTATASLRRPNGTALVSGPDSTTTPIGATATLSLVKSAATPTDTDSSGRTDAGDTIAYSFRVTNTGNVTIRAVAVVDGLVGPVSCPVTTLGPAAGTTCSATYAISQADVDTGAVLNTARATATGPGNTALTSPDSSTSTPTSSAATLALVKTADTPTDVNANGRTDAGDTIGYRFAVTNTGAVTLSAVAIADPLLPTSISCPVGTLAPTAATTCTGTHTITQAEVDAGTVRNTATAGGTDPTGTRVTSGPSTTATTTSTAAALTVDKQAGVPVDVDDDGRVDAGDTITYTFVVNNTGAQSVTFLAVVDSLVTAPCATTLLAPNGMTVCTGSYTVTQADVDAGSVGNTATVTGQRPGGGLVTSQPDSTSTPIQGQQALALDKTAGPPTDTGGNGRTDAGDTIVYSFAVTNVGSVTVTDLTITDAKVPTAISCPTRTLAADETTTCTVPYTITQADVDSGSVRNTATASGTTPGNVAVGSAPDSTTTLTSGLATAEVDKAAGQPADVNANSAVDAGDTVDYTFTVTNTGAVTLTGLTILDSRLSTPAVCLATSLAPAALTTCTGTYAITQADVDAGAVTNTARAALDDPQGRAVVSAADVTTTSTASTASLALTKTAGPPVDVNANSAVDTGDTIAYRFAVTNTGAVTLVSVAITDSLITAGPAGGISCPTTTLTPGGSTTCSATYAIRQADVDAGVVLNTATATGTGPNGAGVTSGPSSTTTPTATTAAITLDKQAGPPVDVNSDGQLDAGDTIDYTFIVTNTGVQTATAVRISDSRLPAAPVCDTTSLAPEAQATCTGTYTLSQADVDAGAVTNTATALAIDPAGDPLLSGTDSTTTSTSTAAALAFDKTADAPADVNLNDQTDAGDTIAYRFDVSNTGSRTVTDLAVADATLLTPIDCAATTLAPAAATTCVATYTITQADVDAGAVVNTATATGLDPAGTVVTSAPDTTRTPTSTLVRVSLDKSAAAPVDTNTSSAVDAGDTIAFSFTVTNDGATTLTAVAVTDPLFGAVSCPPGALAPGLTVVCTATYTITQADVDTGAVSNTATATARTPNGTVATSPADSTNTATSATAALTIDKSAGAPVDVNANGRTDRGDTVTYSFVVTNSGDVTASGVTIRDDLVGAVTCPRTTLLPGEQVTCTTPYAITQADVDSGAVSNTATVTATGPGGAVIIAGPDTTNTSTDPTATLALALSAGTPVDANADGRVDAGDTITYTFVVTNTGSVTVGAIAFADPLLTAAPSCDTTTLLPGAQATCTATHTITQAEVDAGSVVNTARATGTDPAGGPVTSAAASVTTAISTTATLLLDMTAAVPVDANATGRLDAGDTIDFTYVVTNTGTVTVTGLFVDDPQLAASCGTTTLAPGASATCTGTRTITQAEIDAGQVLGSASAAGLRPGGAAVTSNVDATTTPLAAASGLGLVKSAGEPIDANVDGTIGVGDTIAYDFAVTNTGARSVSAIAISDPLVAASCPTGPVAPGATLSCTATYTITQADVDRGAVVNTAYATGTDPEGRVLRSADATVTTAVTPVSALELVKTGAPADTNDDGSIGVGDTVGYRFAVTNAGTTTLAGIAIDDPLIDGASVCELTTLTPGAATTCTATYTITAGDFRAGTVDNTATATGISPAGTTIRSAASSVSIPIPTTVALELVKVAGAPVDVNSNDLVDVGDTIAYTFTVTNTGQQPVTAVAVADPKAGAVTCVATTLAAGATTECTADTAYAITQADLDSEAVNNSATASGLDPAGDRVISNPAATTTATAPGVPGVTLVKTAGPVDDRNGSGTTDAGDTVRFEFLVTNTGNLTLSDVRVDDPMLASAGVAVTCPVTTLAPGESTTCASGTYEITSSQEQAGAVRNTATAVGTSLRGQISGSPGSTAVIPVTTVTDPGDDDDDGDDDNDGNGDNDNDDDNDGNGNGNGDGNGGNLPNTGAAFAPWLPALGLLLMLAGGLTLGLQKRYKYKKE